MATTTIEADLQGVVSNIRTLSSIVWGSDIRNSSTGTDSLTYTSNSSNNNAIQAGILSGRGDQSGYCGRTFLFFDISSILGTITAATLNVLGTGTDVSADTIATEATAWGGDGSTTTLSTSNFGDIDFNTNYSGQLTTWSTSGYNSYTLNSSAISAMNTDGYLNCAVIEYTFDYIGTSPSVGTLDRVGIEFLDSTSPIKLEITYSPSINNITTYSSVIGVEAADIETIIGV